MSEIKQRVFSDHVLKGCLTSILVKGLGTLLISLVFFEWLGWLGIDGQRAADVVLWLAAICIGGYVAARSSAIVGQQSLRTAMWVGIVALLLLLAHLPTAHDKALFTEKLVLVVVNPIDNWRHFVVIVFTVSAALLGWIVARQINDGSYREVAPTNPGPSNE